MAVRKSIQQVTKELKDRIDSAGEFWINRQPASLGNYAGIVKVPDTNNMVYARLENGQVVRVFNTIAPNINNWKVYIGSDKSQPGILKVLEVRWVHNLSQAVGYLLFHHGQHEYPAPDTVWIRRDQFMPLLVLPGGEFNIRVYGDIIYMLGMDAPIRIADITDIDMTNVDGVDYTISSGAKYVLLEILSDGTFNFVDGDVWGTIDFLRVSAPLPAPTPGAFPICAIEFYGGQTSIRRDSAERNIIDLRMFTSNIQDQVAELGDEIHSSTPGIPEGNDEIVFWDEETDEAQTIIWDDLIALLEGELSITGDGIDTSAIHDNVAGEIVVITEKTSIADNDVFVMEDSAASNAKKRVKGSTMALKGVRMVTFAKEGALTTQTGAIRLYNNFGITLTVFKVFISVNTAPTGASILVDCNIDGTTMFTTQSNRPTITATNFTGVTTTVQNNSWADGHYLTFDIDQIGSTIAGSNLTIQIYAGA